MHVSIHYFSNGTIVHWQTIATCFHSFLYCFIKSYLSFISSEALDGAQYWCSFSHTFCIDHTNFLTYFIQLLIEISFSIQMLHRSGTIVQMHMIMYRLRVMHQFPTTVAPHRMKNKKIKRIKKIVDYLNFVYLTLAGHIWSVQSGVRGTYCSVLWAARLHSTQSAGELDQWQVIYWKYWGSTRNTTPLGGVCSLSSNSRCVPSQLLCSWLDKHQRLVDTLYPTHNKLSTYVTFYSLQYCSHHWYCRWAMRTFCALAATQGCDVGTQYRSGIYWHSGQQREMAEAALEYTQDKLGVSDAKPIGVCLLLRRLTRILGEIRPGADKLSDRWPQREGRGWHSLKRDHLRRVRPLWAMDYVMLCLKWFMIGPRVSGQTSVSTSANVAYSCRMSICFITFAGLWIVGNGCDGAWRSD